MHWDKFVYILLYIVIFSIHFTYAVYLISNKNSVLDVGVFRGRAVVLTLLTIINLSGIIVFFVHSRSYLIFQLILHVALLIDEIIRTYQKSFRWPFLLNHFLWLILLGLYF